MSVERIDLEPLEPAARWRLATFSLGFLLLAVCVAWVMREQSVAQDRRREREQWEGDRRFMLEQAEERSRDIERLDLAYDELRRERHHRANPTTARSVDE